MAQAIGCAAAVALTACGTATAPTHVATTVGNKITGFKFQPNPQRVHAGDAVQWTNLDLSQHTSTSDQEGLWDSPRFGHSADFLFRFTTAGDFKYHCAVHPFMHGEIIVEAN